MEQESLDQQNSAELQFGKEFIFNDPESINNVQVLSQDETYYLLQSSLANDLKQGHEQTETFKNTLSFLSKVASTENIEDIVTISETVEQALKNLELETKVDRRRAPLHPFERSALTNLITEDDTTEEEVVTWIPSLSRFDDDELKKVIKIVYEAKLNTGI